MTTIRNITKSRLREIIETYGSTNISSSAVKENEGNDYYVALIKYGFCNRRGYYSIDQSICQQDNDSSEIIHKEVVETTKITQQENIISDVVDIESSATYENRVTQFIKNETLIPEVDSKYVPFGCFKVVESVIRSKTFLPVYVTGLSGNGKTLSVQQACAKHNRELVHINITNGTIEDDLLGCFILEDGNMIWKDGPVLIAMRKGAVLLLDEIDNIGTEAMCLQEVLQNRPVYIKKTNEIVKPVAGFTVVATANTKGTGEGIDKFVGANVLNDAFLERFNVVYEQDYPNTEIEAKILDRVCPDKRFMVNIIRWANEIRIAFKNGSSESCITTRRLVQICQNLAVFNDKVLSVELAINRFVKEDAEGMLSLYKQIAGSRDSKSDGLEKYYQEDSTGTTPNIVANSITSQSAAYINTNNFKQALQAANGV